MSWTEGINTTASGSGRVDDIEGHLQGEIRGPTKLVKMRGRDEMDGQPERARMRDAVESIILSRGLDAIRDSRIASQHGFRDTPWSRSAPEVRTGCVSTTTARLARAE